VSLRVVGVGLGRTGTHSLKLALEQLLGAPCHHMIEVIEHPEQTSMWTAAADGEAEWNRIFDGYAATVDWPSAGFWRELVDQYPDAVVLLSLRASADAWWTSAHRTIFEMLSRPLPDDPALAAMGSWMQTVREIVARNGVDPDDAVASKKAYVRHLDEVRTRVPSERLVEWTAGDGWKPICEALGVVEPDEPFPHVNTTDEFRAMLGLDA
jgi:sulfotransferase family protein